MTGVEGALGEDFKSAPLLHAPPVMQRVPHKFSRLGLLCKSPVKSVYNYVIAYFEAVILGHSNSVRNYKCHNTTNTRRYSYAWVRVDVLFETYFHLLQATSVDQQWPRRSSNASSRSHYESVGFTIA